MEADRLYRELAPALMRYLTRMTGDAEFAADALQETFMRLIDQPPLSNPRAWLYTVATNVVREHGRSTTRRAELLRGAPLDALMGDAARAPDAEYLAHERRKIVVLALARLSERDRTVLLMREEGFSHEEMATAVDTTTKSVGTVIARALRKLEAELLRHREDLT